MKLLSHSGSVLARIVYLGVIALAACNGGSSRGPDVHGSATIGPAGGELAVDSGPQAGLRLVVPAGALSAPTELRVVAPPPPPLFQLVSEHPQPGTPFDLEPAGLVLAEIATLRAPYRVVGVSTDTSPYNVLVRRELGSSSYEIAPVANDAVAQRVDVPVRTLGRYQVVRGPAASSLGEYRSPVGTTLALSGGVTFAVEAVPAGTPFGGNAIRWRISEPAADRDDALYFDGDLLRGREAFGDWREIWNQPFPAWVFGGPTAQAQSLSTPIAVEIPVGGLPIGGTMTVFGLTQFSAPRTVAGQLFNDVLQTTITLAWARQDLGVGQRQYTFYFAPGVGLVGLSQDGLVYERTSL